MANNHNYSNYTSEEAKKEFLEQLSTVKRNGMDRLIRYLESSDFFLAPSGEKGGESREGGQTRHALNVMCRMLINIGTEGTLSNGAVTQDSKLLDSITVVALLHGIWKAGYYRKVLRKKVREDGSEEKVPGYGVRPPDERLCFSRCDWDHGDEAVYILQGFIPLSRAEALAIRSQDWNPKSEEARRIFIKNPLALQFHIAQLQANFIDEIYNVENKNET